MEQGDCGDNCLHNRRMVRKNGHIAKKLGMNFACMLGMMERTVVRGRGDHDLRKVGL